jgi:hypothetical protein
MGDDMIFQRWRESRDVLPAAIWRQEIQARARRIKYAADHASGIRGEETPLRIRRLLCIAMDASKVRGVCKWWHGTMIERAWLALHDAEVETVSTMSDADARLWWERVTRQQRVPGGGAAARLPPRNAAQCAASLRGYFDQSDRLFGDTRLLRNRLICLTVIGAVLTVLLLIAGCLGVWHIHRGPTLVVSGRVEFLLVALFGVIGAFISGLPALSRAPRQLSPSWTAPQQLALKLAVGPLFALLGVLTVDAGFVDLARPVARFGGLVLLWAVIFGSAQQLLTGILDRKAANLAEASAETAHTRRAEEPVAPPLWIPAQPSGHQANGAVRAGQPALDATAGLLQRARHQHPG